MPAIAATANDISGIMADFRDEACLFAANILVFEDMLKGHARRPGTAGP
jgi:hypothetical protein